MAKKIIKEPTIRRYKATCPICGCEFEFDTTDARWHEYEDCFLSRVWCPVCDFCIEEAVGKITDEK